MDKLLADLHALKKELEFQGCWFMAAQIEKSIQRRLKCNCHFCNKPVEDGNLKDHQECLGKLYDVVFVEKKTA